MDAISVNDYGLQVISPKFKHSTSSVIFLAPVNHSIVLWADQIKIAQENLAPASS